MIIWRGWGILTFLGFVPALVLTVAVRGHFAPVAAGIGLLVGGAAVAVFGRWLNVVRPAQIADRLIEARRVELAARVEAGSYRQTRPGAVVNGILQPPQVLPVPSSIEDARQQADAQLAAESAQVRKDLRNQHSLFFIPMEYLGYAILVLSAIWIGVGLAM